MRRPDWIARLRAEVERASAQPFEWGRQDCCLFAARCVDAMIAGSEYVAELRTAYTDKASALRFLVEQGGIEAGVTARFGPPVPWPRAMRGDLVLVDTEDGVGSLGVCLGEMSVFISHEHGVEYLPTRSVRACWSVR